MIFGFRSVHEVAWARAAITAVILNAVSGMFLVAIPAVFLAPSATGTLLAVLFILFGPLIGFICSSVYSRLECFVGRRLGGKASLDDLYRIFAWFFLPLSFALLLYVLLDLFSQTLMKP